MKETEIVVEYFDWVIIASNHFRLNGEEVSTNIIVEKILRTLVNKLDHIVSIIKETKDLDYLIIECLMGSLQAHGHHLNQRAVHTSTSSIMQAYKVQLIFGDKF